MGKNWLEKSFQKLANKVDNKLQKLDQKVSHIVQTAPIIQKTKKIFKGDKNDGQNKNKSLKSFLQKMQEELIRPFDYMSKAGMKVTLDQDVKSIGSNIKKQNINIQKNSQILQFGQLKRYLIKQNLHQKQVEYFQDLDDINLSQIQIKTRENFDLDKFNQYSIAALLIEPLDNNTRRVVLLKKTFNIQYHQPILVKKIRTMHYGLGMRKSNYEQNSQDRPMTAEQKKIIQNALIKLTQQCDIDTEIHQYNQRIKNEQPEI